MVRRTRLTATFAAVTIILAAGSSEVSAGQGWSHAYEAGMVGGGYAIGQAIGEAAISGRGGYDGGTPTGYDGGPGPAARPCYVRRPVYDDNGTMIGYRGTQLC